MLTETADGVRAPPGTWLHPYEHAINSRSSECRKTKPNLPALAVVPVDPDLVIIALDKDVAKSRHKLGTGGIAGQSLAELSPGTPGASVKQVGVDVVISSCFHMSGKNINLEESRTTNEDVKVVKPSGQVWRAVRLNSAGNLLERTPAMALMSTVPEMVVVAANYKVECIAEDSHSGGVESLWKKC